MSLFTHLVVLFILLVDLIFGAAMIERVGGPYAMRGFEFLLILGYIIFVLQWGVPWGRRERDDP